MKSSDAPMKWLKLWTEARNDGKLRCLSDYEHRIWFRLLCYAAEQEPAGKVRASWKLLAAECADGDIDRLKSAVTELTSLQLVTLVTGVTCNENVTEISFHNFDKRQSKSPSDARYRVAERVRKHREAKKLRQQSFLVTSCNGDETGRNGAETETDTEIKSVVVTHTREGDDLKDWREAVAELQGSKEGKLIAGMLQESAEVPSVQGLEAWRFIHAAHILNRPSSTKTWEYFMGIARKCNRAQFDAWHALPSPNGEAAGEDAKPAPRGRQAPRLTLEQIAARKATRTIDPRDTDDGE
jgi:hypothetical protein